MTAFLFILWATLAAILSLGLGPAVGIIGASAVLLFLYLLERLGAGLFAILAATGRGLGRIGASLLRRAR